MSIQVESLTDDSITLITLDEPAVHNAISAVDARSLADVLTRLDAAPDIRVVVITGRGSAFSSGMDLRDLSAGKPIPLDFFRILSEMTKPVIAAVNGVAATGGLELALACDLRIASERAVLVDLHAQLGMLPGSGGTARLARLIGPSRALEMALTGRRIAAEEAVLMGLVDRITAHDALLDSVGDIARRIARIDPTLMSHTLPLYRAALDSTTEDALERERDAIRSWRRVADLTSAHERFRSLRSAD